MAARKTVATMDEAEREYKRWNDRVNQQYSRARKRRRFEELQSQNKKLTAELESTKAELESFRRREAAVRSALDWVSTIVNNHDSSSSQSNRPRAESIELERPQLTPRNETQVPTLAPATSKEQSNLVSLTLANPASTQAPEYGQQAMVPTDVQSNGFGDFSSTFNSLNGNCVLNLPMEFGDGAWVNLLSTDMWSNQSPAEVFNHAIAPMTPEQSPTGISQGTSNYALAEEQSDSDSVPSVTYTANPAQQMQLASPSQAWQELPLNVGATNELDKVLLEVTALGRQWKTRQGAYHSELSHPSFPSISSLLNRDVENDRSNNPLAAALAKYTVTTPVVNFPRKVAFHYTVAHLLRWLVSPTEESFNQLPEFLRPTTVQKKVPHPAWIDTVPWPQARDRIILNLHLFDYEVFKRVTRYSSINWPCSDRELFIAKQGSKQMMLNPRFVRHILNLNNWTNGPDLAKAFPFLSGWPTCPPTGPYQWPD